MSISIIIIIITVGASIYAWNSPDLMRGWMMNPYMIAYKKQYYRFLTSGLIHSNYIHLAFNTITLYFFGDVIEQVFTYYFGSVGTVYFIVLYLGGMIVADIPTFLKNRHNSNFNSLGASGAVSAVVFAAILFHPTAKLCLFFAICMPGFIFGILFLIYSFFQGKRMADNINHDAHFYGALFGLVFSIILQPTVIVSFFNQIANFKFF